MRKVSLILGVVGGILGGISCIILLFSVSIQSTHQYKVVLEILDGIGIVVNILVLIGACIKNKNYLTGVFMLAGALVNIPRIIISDGNIFILFSIASMLILVSGIIRLNMNE
ncbi:hypothetical protein NSA50_09695 [Clostridium sp. DSM 100503]|uniref:hypothetical protein n=1 Tax=Clostridium sp. DSM 100503 TaxID=2963282 RepID=UPI00214A7DD7|nr:hypothetical protein [Clostridium sp. DSM 100503]MCR1951321.1 hypothetical protein [Clostridium sp. DSM 100503]